MGTECAEEEEGGERGGGVRPGGHSPSGPACCDRFIPAAVGWGGGERV